MKEIAARTEGRLRLDPSRLNVDAADEAPGEQAAHAEVAVVGHLRPPAVRLESWYAQRARSADEAAPSEAFAKRMVRPEGCELLRYNAVFSPWREAFPNAGGRGR